MVAVQAVDAQANGAPGRPAEIEDPTNLALVHPLARALARALIGTPVTPNQVSAASVIPAAAAAAAYVALPWPFGALGGLACQYIWHVLDGADGELARRTGRASPIGELVDGVCDHLSQGLLYLAFGWVAARQIGPLAWLAVVAAAGSHFVQSNAYETWRKSYRRAVYGATWMRQNLQALAVAGPLQALIGRIYVAVSSGFGGGEEELERTVGLAADPAESRVRYRRAFAAQVRAGCVLDSNTRTLATFAAMLAGSPLWYLGFEALALNAVLAGLLIWRSRLRRRFDLETRA
ncbi:MAG TPA: CDP-alcohol phosphatidyltransferase family protein [Caulobacteraceae bacterium]|nr:CDP-alcohol phosphatidyltransferase family protein [Caulobacteraceae bacterium]